MGGNAIVQNHFTQETFFAEKIPLQVITRPYFRQTITNFIVDFNNLYEQTGSKLWEPDLIASGTIYNGSTSFIMNPNFDDAEIEAVKPYVGDIDIVVPKENREKLFLFLRGFEGKDITPDVRYLGCNKPELKPGTSQINCVFQILFRIESIGELKVNCQVDFEFADFIDGKPSEWARFGHSSNLKDAKVGIKAVHHKYLLRALVGTMYTDKKGVVVMNGVILAKPARVKIFDVTLGICDQFEIIDQTQDQTTYRQLQRFQFTGERDLKEVFRLCFNRYPQNDDLDKFWSFVGLCELMGKYTNPELLPEIHQRYLNLLWESSPERTQELERNNPTLDLDVKLKGYEYFIQFFGLEDLHEPMITDYYPGFGTYGKCNLAESFKAFVAKKNYIHEEF